MFKDTEFGSFTFTNITLNQTQAILKQQITKLKDFEFEPKENVCENINSKVDKFIVKQCAFSSKYNSYATVIKADEKLNKYLCKLRQ